MNKTKSIVWLCVIVIVLALYAVVSFLPRFEISATDDFIPVVEQITLGTDLALSEYPNYRVAEGTVFNVNEYYTGIDGSYVDAEGNPVEDADKVKIPADELEKRVLNTAETMRKRLSLITNSNYEVTVLDGNKIYVELSDITNSLTVFELLKGTGYVQFKLLPESPTDDTDFTQYDDVLSYEQVTFYGLNYDSSTSSYYILFNFAKDGASTFKEASRAYREDSDNTMYLCYLVDGVLQGSPLTISSVYTASYIYFTGFTSQNAAITSGLMIENEPYEAPLIKSNIEMIYLSSKLGEKAASSLLYAGLILLGVCMVIMVIRFKGMGIAAALSLALYAMLLISFFVLVPAMPFNLSNALGAIVSVVIAFAAQVLMLVYVERRFSELHKSRKLALKDGLKASVLPLIGLHVGVFAAAIPCAVFMQGAIVGFALSVIFGAIVSCISLLFTVLLVYVLNPLFANDKAFGLRVSLKEGK